MTPSPPPGRSPVEAIAAEPVVEGAPGPSGADDPAEDEDLFPGLPETTDPEERSPALRLARIHLRNGALALARVELESLDGDGRLDRTGLLDLAECCWRMADLEAAGAPIERYLAAGGRDPLGFVVAAEYAAAHGRPTEARRFAGRARAAADLDLERLFSGTPRSDVWPASGLSLEDTLFRLPALPETVHPAGGSPSAALPTGGATPGPQGAFVPAASVASELVGSSSTAASVPGTVDPGADQPGLWDGADPVRPASSGGDELATALDALSRGDDTTAALSLGVALRLDPSHAPVILEATRHAHGPAIMLVRGDAYRAVGDEVRARAAYAAAAMRPPPAGTPAEPVSPADPAPGTADPAGAAHPGASGTQPSAASGPVGAAGEPDNGSTDAR